MKKNYLLMLLASVMVLGGCNNKVSSSSSSNEVVTSSSSTAIQKELPPEAIDFILFVDSIVLNEEAGAYINEAFEMFENLVDWNYDEVLNAYYKLCHLEEIYNDYLVTNNLAKAFIEKVELIPYFLEITDEKYILSAEESYENLTPEAKEILGVEEAYQRLLKARSDFDALYAQSIEEELEKEIISFLNLVNELPSKEGFLVEDYEDLLNALDAYEYLSDKAKEDARVIEAYNKLLELEERYQELIDNPSLGEEIYVEAFLNLVNSLPSEENVTLDDGKKIFEAKEKYKLLSSEAKAKDEVIEAYAKLEKVLKAFYVIYLENQEAGEVEEDELTKALRELAALVSFIPSIDEITKDDGASIANAEMYYDKLSIATINNSEIKEYYKTISSAKEKLNSLLDTKITFAITGLIRSADVVPNIVLQSINYDNVKTLYGVSSTNELRTKASMYLYAYDSDNNLKLRFNISETMYSNGFIIGGNSVVSAFESNSMYDESLVAGNFKFSIRIEDRTGLYADSDFYSGSTIPYSFTNQYNPNPEGEIIKVSTKEDLLNIKNNLNGKYELVNDIDLENMDFENLGNFAGVLDGKGHTIYNFTSSLANDASFGLFLEITASGVVKNLALEGKVNDAGPWAGAITVRNRGVISNCYINLDISASGNVGGIVCENFATIEYCLVLSKVNGDYMDGGIAVGQYGTVKDTYFLVDNISNGQAIGNNGSLNNECSKTSDELKVASLYSSWDKTTWCVIEGYYPTLIPQ